MCTRTLFTIEKYLSYLKNFTQSTKLVFLVLMTFVLFTNYHRLYAEEIQTINSFESYSKSLEKLEVENQNLKSSLDTLQTNTNNLWTIIAAFLVFFMQAGFALVEAGFTRAKNTVNILMKNISDFSVASIGFWMCGFSLMFGAQYISEFGVGKLFGVGSYVFPDFLGESSIQANELTFFFFQVVFAGTSATIASGAMAERTKFISYLIYSFVMSILIYPIFGSLAWGSLFAPRAEQKGFLEALGFIDFAGSTVVHSVGAWAGLAGTLALGARIDRYINGKVEPIFGHNMSFATLGFFILWFGWFGFNPGSTTSVEGSRFSMIAVNTNIAAAGGALAAMTTCWFIFKMPDIGITLNGGLAGLVAITAGCNNLNIGASLLVGSIAGSLTVFSVLLLDKLKIDDPVGAISVHGTAGVWGTLSVGLFANPKLGESIGLFYGGGWKLLGVQALGVVIAFLWSFSMSWILFRVLRWTVGLRVSEDEEIVGLDILEHGNEAYPMSK